MTALQPSIAPKSKPIVLVTFNEEHKLQHEGFCSIVINKEFTKMVSIYRKNKSWINAPFTYNFILNKNMLCIVALDRASDIILIFQTAETCKKAYDKIIKLKVYYGISITADNIPGTTRAEFGNRFLNPLLAEIGNEVFKKIVLNLINSSTINGQNQNAKEKINNPPQNRSKEISKPEREKAETSNKTLKTVNHSPKLLNGNSVVVTEASEPMDLEPNLISETHSSSVQRENVNTAQEIHDNNFDNDDSGFMNEDNIPENNENDKPEEPIQEPPTKKRKTVRFQIDENLNNSETETSSETLFDTRNSTEVANNAIPNAIPNLQTFSLPENQPVAENVATTAFEIRYDKTAQKYSMVIPHSQEANDNNPLCFILYFNKLHGYFACGKCRKQSNSVTAEILRNPSSSANYSMKMSDNPHICIPMPYVALLENGNVEVMKEEEYGIFVSKPKNNLKRKINHQATAVPINSKGGLPKQGHALRNRRITELVPSSTTATAQEEIALPVSSEVRQETQNISGQSSSTSPPVRRGMRTRSVSNCYQNEENRSTNSPIFTRQNSRNPNSDSPNNEESLSPSPTRPIKNKPRQRTRSLPSSQNVEEQPELEEIITAENFRLLPNRNGVPKAKIEIKLPNSLVYSYYLHNCGGYYHCHKCNNRDRRVNARLVENDGAEPYVVLYGNKHVCKSTKPQKIYQKSNVYSNFVFLPNTKGEKDSRLLIYNNSGEDQEFYNTYKKTKLFYCCDCFNKKGEEFSVIPKIGNDNKQFLELQNSHHACPPRNLMQLGRKINSSKYKIIKDSNGNEKIKVQSQNNSSLYYQLDFDKKSKAFKCKKCETQGTFTCGKEVTIAESSEKFLIMNRNHKCSAFLD